MELNELLLSVRRDVLEDPIPIEMNSLCSADWSFDPFYDTSPSILPHPFEQNFTNFALLDQACSYPSGIDLSAQQKDDSFDRTLHTPPISNLDDEDELFLLPFEASCKVEAVPMPEGNVRTKKLQRKPSKNLMAERRRRKRLNDRLTMLRSIIPKISKMDRSVILGDAIDYMKELSEKISYLKQEIEVGSDQFDSVMHFKDVKLNEFFVRTCPKMEVEERNGETWITICCSGKPRLLSLTVNILDALGLEVNEYVISSFHDFTMHASCSQELKQGIMAAPEEVKNAFLGSVSFKQPFECLLDGGTNSDLEEREEGKREKKREGILGFLNNTCRARDLFNGKLNGLI